MAGKMVVTRAHQVSSSRRRISGCGSISEQVQGAGRAQACGRQGAFAALKPPEDIPLFFPGDQECCMSAALERRIGQGDTGGFRSDDRRHPSLALFEHGGTRE